MDRLLGLVALSLFSLPFLEYRKVFGALVALIYWVGNLTVLEFFLLIIFLIIVFCSVGLLVKKLLNRKKK